MENKENNNSQEPRPIIPDIGNVIDKATDEMLRNACFADKFTVFDSKTSGAIVLISGSNEKGAKSDMIITLEELIYMSDTLKSAAEKVEEQIKANEEKPMVNIIEPQIIVP